MLGNHLLGIYEKALPPEMTWDERLTAAKKLGFDFVEISIDEADSRIERLYWDEERKHRLHKAIWETGVGLQTMCLSAHRRFPFGSADPALREKAMEIMERAIVFAREFGIRVIQLAGYDVYYERSTEESRADFEEGLRRACALAAKHQVMLAMEIMDTRLLSSISRYECLKRRIDSPWLTVYPDLGNLSAWGNDVETELRLGGSGIVGVHIKDTLPVSGGFPGKFKLVPFGDGCVDFPLCFRTLEEQGYTGTYMIEMWHQEGRDALADISAALDFVRERYETAVEGLR